ncbi:MAG: acyl carrier protein [Abitibacteriaceae bacterium]|nr:acyl carrier protein [Abditibacteriaceae bacterium]MBV9864811.1 acyl carrier protein [Abditibacteriaceae bacterium]
MTVAAKVIEIIVDELGVDPALVTPDAQLEGGHLWGSLNVVEFIMRCEEEFGIEIPDEDAERIPTVGTAINYLEKRVGLEWK